ncbi:copper amine oxidase N-terminal domain-containing protein [Anaerotignum sp.]|uniref:copper amine oxidase N-terminal domain-containing protein n=1 Tax=Anaerotignum sp. TaxID=2039241 RepID=UPI0028A614B8|nr:copper amine oxidase N-terminal domain-containing protein [Anaerotignum sp.]
MKKFISLAMAAAMVASLVPATAFAAGDVTATAKVVDALEKDKTFNGVINQAGAPELQLKVTGTDYKVTNSETAKMDVELTLDKAEFKKADGNYMNADELKALVGVIDENGQPVLGEWRENIGAGVTATDAPTALNDTTKIAAAIFDGTALPADLAFYKDSDKTYKFIKAADYAADHKVDEEKATPSLEDRQNAAFVAWLATAGITVTTDGAAVDGTNWETYYKLATWNGNDAYILKTGAAALLTGAVEPVYVSDLTVAPATKYTADEIKAEIKAKLDSALASYTTINTVKVNGGSAGVDGGTLSVEVKDFDKDSVTYTFKGFFKKDDKVIFDLASTLTKTSEGTKATVSVDSKMVTADDLVYASILGKGLKVSVKKLVDVAEEEIVALNSNGLKIESSVGDFAANSKITLKVSKGFEFVKNTSITVEGSANSTVERTDDNELTVTVGTASDEITLKGIKIEAASAKSGAVATITAKSSNMDSASCEVAKVVDYKVTLSVDADEDVPVIYSGVNVKNDGITDDSDHMSLEVTAKETFAGAWSMRQGFNFNLPEGVYVTDVKVTEVDGFYQNRKEIGTTEWDKAFEDAYKDGDHKNFEFAKRTFDDVDYTLDGRDKAEVTFQLELVADPTFEGDVKLTFEGPLVDKQEATIAKFVKPYTVKAEQNDLIIDYRNTEIKTPIVITEAEEGLWEKGAEFRFNFDKKDIMEFEKDATFEIDKDSELEVKDDTNKGTLKFTIKEESDAKATVTIKDMKLFMQRNIPAGAYDLEINTSLEDAYKKQGLFAPDQNVAFDSASRDKDKESFVDDVCDYSEVVKEAFINVVTSGRDQDNLFTTKVVVPVGEKYLVAGENKVELDVAAYISDAGYTMLPVRAISKALGVNTNNVLWNAEARTVTIMYGQRIITMTVGQKTIYVNGSAIPASAAPEIRDGRTFLPLRDLGTALGVTDVTWDAATKTATLNGGTK